MSGKITPNYIAVRKGDSFTIRFQFKCGNEFVDISGSSLKMQVKNQSDKKTVPPKTPFRQPIHLYTNILLPNRSISSFSNFLFSYGCILKPFL